MLLKQSTAKSVMVKLFLSSDHVSVATGKTLTVTLSKDGAAFASAGAAVTEVANGWYKVALTTTDTATLGQLVLRATATSCDDAELRLQVVAFDPETAWSTYAGADTSGTTTLLSRVTSTRAGNLDNLDAAISTRSTYAGADTSGTTTLLSRLTSGRAANLDNVDAAVSSRSSHSAADVWAVGTRSLTTFGTLVADVWAYATRTLSAFAFSVTASTVSDKTGYALTSAYDAAKAAAQASDIPSVPTTAQIADKVLGRNIAGGSDGGRTVSDALRVSRNKVVRSGSTLTVYAEDDTTVAWTATITTSGTADPVIGVDPA